MFNRTLKPSTVKYLYKKKNQIFNKITKESYNLSVIKIK